MTRSTDKHTRPRRSFIFSPGLNPDFFPKALVSGADMVCVELEDGIAPKHKIVARAKTMALFANPQAMDGVERIVRINSLRTSFGLADVQAILDTDTPPPALMLPKVNGPDEVTLLDELLSERGHPTRLHVVIESNAALEAVHDIARSSDRLESLFFGAEDMAAELRCQNAWEPLLYARSRVVHAAAAAGLDVMDVPYRNLGDPDGMQREAILSRDLGFTGKGAIHPNQISMVNNVFTPDGRQVAYARKVIDAFESQSKGLVVIDGKVIEAPVLREMHRVVTIAERAARVRKISIQNSPRRLKFIDEPVPTENVKPFPSVVEHCNEQLPVLAVSESA